MLKILSFISILVYTVQGKGEFVVLHHPQSAIFKGHDPVKESILGDIYSVSLGFSIEQDSNWQGLYLKDPFNLAEAVVTVAVDGVSDIGPIKGHNFPLHTNEDESEIFAHLERNILVHEPSGESKLIRVDLSNGLDSVHSVNIFNDIKHTKAKKTKHNYLKVDIDEDREFLQELALLNAIIDKVESGVIHRNYLPSVFWFKVSSLHALVDLHGDNSTAVKEAKMLLNDALIKLNSAFTKVYGDDVLISIIASDSSHTRRTRNILEAKKEEKPQNANPFDNLNLAKPYSENYPVIFNIILWFGVVMVFALLATSLVIANMDPGRDSIIYRMTSQRMKKDN